MSTVQWTPLENFKTAWFVDAPCICPYAYAKHEIPPQTMTPFLKSITRIMEDIVEITGFNCANLNLYENGMHSVGLHADGEPLFQSLKQSSPIISLSLGASRTFRIRHNVTGSVRDVQLKSGDICTMEGLFQKHFRHGIPKDLSGTKGPRINITWRIIVKHVPKCPLFS
jgi:alkylated DNA repair dioxygenase AlkB